MESATQIAAARPAGRYHSRYVCLARDTMLRGASRRMA
jgi:hypothetical protein